MKISITIRSACIALLLAQCPSHAARIYYTDQPASSAGTIRAVGMDGSSPALIVSYAAGADLRGIAWHRASGRIFFLDNGASTKRIRSIFPNGTGQQDLTATDSGAGMVGSDVEIHDAAGHLYWTEHNSGTTGNGYIRRVNLDGSGAVTVVTTAPGIGNSPYFMSVDAPAGFLYWGVQENPAGGSQPTSFRRNTLAGVADAAFSITTTTRTRDIQIDPITAAAYWNDRQTGTILKRAVSGGAIVTVLAGLNAPHGIALDVEARKIYWADTGQRGGGPQAPASSARRIARCNFDGSGFEVVTTPAINSGAGANEPWDLALDLASPTFAEWKTRFFSPATPLAQPLDDADGDGSENVLEYGLGTNPRGAESVPTPVAEGGGVRFMRRAGTNLAFRVETSADLATWHFNGDGSGLTWTVESSVTPAGDFDSVLTTPGPALAGAARVFFRIAVSSP